MASQQPQQQSPRPEQPSKLATSSHMMKTTKRGRPFLKDTLDLFATLIVSLDLQTHKQYFRSFPNSFTTDEACLNLASLKFSQSNRGPDPRDPSRIVTTTTTTTFSMTRDMAKAMCQHYMDARLIENAADPTSNVFKDRGIYVLTPKGLHVLERFISKNGMTADHLLTVFSSQPICLKLLHLERRASDDEIIISQSVITALFRRFAGRQANYMPELGNNADPNEEYHERSKGIPLFDLQERPMNMTGKNVIMTFNHCFSAVSALEWLCDFTSIVARDEAAEMAAHFVRFGLIALVSDKRKGGDSAVIFTVRGNAQGSVSAQGEFRCTAKAVYNITEAGRKVVRWDGVGRSLINTVGLRSSPNNSTTNLESTHHRPSADNSSVENVTTASEVAYGPGGGEPTAPATLAQTTDAKIHRRISMAEKLRNDYKAGEATTNGGSHGPKESNTDRLRHILEEPALRSLFREFLRGNFCEENLSFWLDVQDFKRRFNTTSSANAAPRQNHHQATANGSKATPGQAAMEKHHEALISMAFVIYNTYLAPSSPCELNIDHGLRNELRVYLDEVLASSNNGGKKMSTSSNGRLELENAQMQMHAFNATQLQTMIKLYEKIQSHVFKLMATDSVPKFIKTSRFMALRNWVEEYEVGEMDLSGPSVSEDHESIRHGKTSHSIPSAPPGLDDPEEVGRAYMSVSQQALRKNAAVESPNQLHDLPITKVKSAA